MRYEITTREPIIDKHDEFCDFLARHSDGFSLSGQAKDVAASKKSEAFEQAYRSIMPYLVWEKQSGNICEYYFSIVPQTLQWLKNRPQILGFPMPLEFIGFYKGDNKWCAAAPYRAVLALEIESGEQQKEFEALLDKPYKIINDFIDAFNRQKGFGTEEDFIKTMARSPFENNFFLQQFDRNFFEKRWNSKILGFYSDDESLRLFAKILVARGEHSLTDNDLLAMSFWLTGINTWIKSNMRFDEVFSGSEVIYEFFTTLDAERYWKMYQKIIMTADESCRLKLLLEVFERSGYEIKDEILRQAHTELANAYREWSGADTYKVWSMKYRFECRMQLRGVGNFYKSLLRRKHELVRVSDSDKALRKGVIYVEESNVSLQKSVAYDYLNIGTLIHKNAASKAVFWFKRLADLGDLDCQIDLGKCFLNGFGVKKDTDQAKYWLGKAAQQGSIAAQQLLRTETLNE